MSKKQSIAFFEQAFLFLIIYSPLRHVHTILDQTAKKRGLRPQDNNKNKRTDKNSRRNERQYAPANYMFENTRMRRLVFNMYFLTAKRAGNVIIRHFRL